MNHTYIIAEAGVNHNGSLELAQKLVDVAVEAGANAIKFQTFKADHLVNRQAPKAEYQMRLTDKQESQYMMLKKLELGEEEHKALIDYCQVKGIDFLSTPFDLESLHMLHYTFNISRLKIASGEITNAPLLLAAGRTGKPIILSTGMSTLGEIEWALSVLAFAYLYPTTPPSLRLIQEVFASIEGQQILKEKVTLLHCTTEYPAPFSEVNLRMMDTLSRAFDLSVGLSDHTPGIAISIAAVARGAKVIEKHITLDKKMEGPDHQASLEPHEFKTLVESIRQVEQALGHSVKVPSPSEMKNREIVRKSIVAKRNIKKGERFTEENITIKRPGHGISPMYYWELLGQKADRDYQEDEVIMPWTSL